MTHLRLIDVPHVVDYRARRADLVAKMAKDLVRFDAATNESDAIRSLFGAGYNMADVMMLVDDARALAFQEIVAQEMAKS